MRRPCGYPTDRGKCTVSEPAEIFFVNYRSELGYNARMRKFTRISKAMFILAVLLFFLYRWLVSTFDVSLEAIIFTMRSPVEGADTSFVRNGILKVGIPTVIICAVVLFLTEVIYKAIAKKSKSGAKGFRIFTNVVFIISLVISGIWVDTHMHVSKYISRRIHATTIYEDNYIDPAKVEITAPEKKKNLIYIYMESMETKYTSEKYGGVQEKNLIPYLTDLAENNLYFSGTSGFGGYKSYYELTGWTVASIFAGSSGLPLAIPIMDNRMGFRQKFAPTITTLGDILDKNGYKQEFLCGSDAEFGGRKILFQQHGNYDIFDYYTAIEKKYIPEDYFVWWGFEDKYLYQIAKDEITRLAKEDEPFNFTMLTVDTHNIGGYVCDLCGDEYDRPIANVIDCADNQIEEFMGWLEKQDFYDDTMVVIVGDHPRMDNMLVEDVPYEERGVYNCFINPTLSGSAPNTFSRDCSAMDLFPTVLSGLGFDIPGHRLGLGTDLFSDLPTLSEEIGPAEYEEQLCRYSQFLTDIFAYKLD